MSRTRILLAACASAALGAGALACGPDFPWRLLQDRPTTLKATPANTFAFEAKRFVPRPQGVPDAVDPPEIPYWQRKKQPQLPDKFAESDGLQPGQIELVRQMRTAGSQEECDKAGQDLPDELRLYTSGACAFARQNWALAEERFAAVLALPPEQRGLRGVWARYSLGRLRLATGDLDGAIEAFRAVRADVKAGASDPQGLASASLGEEARAHLERAKSAADPAKDLVAATRLYAEQGSTGAAGAPLSLRIVAQNLILDRQGVLEAVISDPVTQRVLVAYVLARTFDASPTNDHDDAGLRQKGVTPNEYLVRVVEAAEKSGVSEIVGSDRLAAAAYRMGRYDLAERLAARSASPLGNWVAAKMAIQNGDDAGAVKRYAAAVRSLEGAGDVLEPWMSTRLSGEFATAMLSRGQVMDAFELLYRHGTEFWSDLSYVADRILTTEELKKFVDRKVPAPPPGTKREGYNEDDPQTWQPVKPLPTALRNLLARRLVRDGRFDDAIPYFDRGEIRDRVFAYGKALKAAAASRDRMQRAKAWYTAGMLARLSGMEMMGSEDAPDFSVYDGSFSQDGVPDGKPGPYVPKVEVVRAKASVVRPDLRFHYRFVAFDHMMRAADQLPPKSQSAAAVLCRAAEWMRTTKDGGPLYRKALQRFKASGATLEGAQPFAHECPDPEAFGERDPLLSEPAHEPIQVPG